MISSPQSALPPWNSKGLLDPGIYPTDLNGIYERFVADAPHRQHRETLFSCFTCYCDFIKPFVGTARLWVNGGFSMQKPEAPHDVDVAIVVDDTAALDGLSHAEYTDLLGLLTLQDVIVGAPITGHLPRIQPIGGALDAFLVPPEHQDAFIDTWSSVKRNGTIVPGETKGFAEVRI